MIDISVFYGDELTVTAVWNSESAPVFFDYPDGLFRTGDAIVDQPSIRYQSSDFVGMSTGVTLTIGSVTYQVTDVQRINDGLEKRANLSRV